MYLKTTDPSSPTNMDQYKFRSRSEREREREREREIERAKTDKQTSERVFVIFFAYSYRVGILN